MPTLLFQAPLFFGACFLLRRNIFFVTFMMVAESVERVIRPIIEAENIELVEVEYKKEGSQFFLRVYIDKLGGVTHDLCGKMSSQIGALLDIEEIIQKHYVLEVSSPGVERPLKRKEDYIRFTGKKISIRLFVPKNGKKQLTGTILQIEGDTILLQCDEDSMQTFQFKDIAKANLFFEF